MPDMGYQKRLESGAEVYFDNTNLSKKTVKTPAIFRDGDTAELIVGSSRYPLAGGLIESYELAKMASGPAPE